jgi:TIGR03440 family protein
MGSTCYRFCLNQPSDDPAARAEELPARYQRIRCNTERLCEPLSPEDCTVQSMPDASPAKWHLAHTSWFFETFVLTPHVPGYREFHPQYRALFNSYYHTVGDQYPRPQRGLLTRPALDEVRAYRAHVDHHMLGLMKTGGELDSALAQLIVLGFNHEQQHQELILTDIKHMFFCNPLHPAYQDRPPLPPCEPSALSWHHYEEGLRAIGQDEPEFAFDNERPRHKRFVHAFELASRPVTNGEFLAFIEEGGYQRPELWLSDGWDAVRKYDWRAPLYWERYDDTWIVMTLSGQQSLCEADPVCHVSYYEAEAMARWAGARLPAEAEWEYAASEAPLAGNFVESGPLQPRPARGQISASAPVQLFGDVWEWTQNPYTPYPGYQPPSGALGEYNGKFMCNQIVLRGGSCATPRSHIRRTYRNFFYPEARWQFSGIRLARDV